VIVNKNNVWNFAWSHWYFGDLAAFVASSSYVSTAHAHKCLFREVPVKNSDIGVRFLDPDFLANGEISAIWGRFQLFFIELEKNSVERDICPVATVQRPNCSYNKAYIAYFTVHARNGHISASDLRTFSVDFFIGIANIRHISTSGLFGLLT